MWNIFLKIIWLALFLLFVMVMPNPDLNHETHVACSKSNMDIPVDIQPIQISTRTQTGIRITTSKHDFLDISDKLKEKQFLLGSNDVKKVLGLKEIQQLYFTKNV